MYLVDSDIPRGELREARSLSAAFYPSELDATSQFEDCFGDLDPTQKTLAITSLGSNDALGFERLVLNRSVSPQEFREALENQFSQLQQKQGVSTVKLGLLPLHQVLTSLHPDEYRGLVVTGRGPFGLSQGPQGTIYAFLPTAQRIRAHLPTNHYDILTQSEYDDFKAYIQELQQIEDDVCKKYGVTLVRIDEYLELALKTDKLSLESLISYDGYHPQPRLKALLTLARGLEAHQQGLALSPTLEVLEQIASTLEIDVHDLASAFEMENSLKTFVQILELMPAPVLPDYHTSALAKSKTLIPRFLHLGLREQGYTLAQLGLSFNLGLTLKTEPIYSAETSEAIHSEFSPWLGLTSDTVATPIGRFEGTTEIYSRLGYELNRDQVEAQLGLRNQLSYPLGFYSGMDTYYRGIYLNESSQSLGLQLYSGYNPAGFARADGLDVRTYVDFNRRLRLEDKNSVILGAEIAYRGFWFD